MVMEYVAGETLPSLLKERRPLPLRERRTILGGVAATLDDAHQQGM
jgi:serine/threonine protein kinase